MMEMPRPLGMPSPKPGSFFRRWKHEFLERPWGQRVVTFCVLLAFIGRITLGVMADAAKDGDGLASVVGASVPFFVIAIVLYVWTIKGSRRNPNS
jgi:hypothetical protein